MSKLGERLSSTASCGRGCGVYYLRSLLGNPGSSHCELRVAMRKRNAVSLVGASPLNSPNLQVAVSSVVPIPHLYIESTVPSAKEDERGVEGFSNETI